MGGSTIQLFAIGPQDFHLTGNPQITFFKSVFRRHTKFLKETRHIHFSGNKPTFGSQDVIAKVRKEGDLLSKLYLEATITGTSSSYGAYTVNHFGNSLIKKAEFEIGGYVIDTLHSQWLQIYDELSENICENKQTISGPKGGRYSDLNFTTDLDPTEINVNNKIYGDCPLVFGGYRNGITTTAGKYTKKIIIPLQFWFTKNPGLYLPICALYKHELVVKLSFEEIYKLVGNSTTISKDTLIGNFKLYGEFITLDDEEKRRYSQSDHEYIIEQVQLNNNGPSVTSSTVDGSLNQLAKVEYDLNFIHPIKYFVWVIVNEGNVTTSLSNNSGQGPCYFVSLCSNSVYGNDANNGTVELLLDGVEREIELPMMYYTRMYPKNHCKNIPDLDRIGLYSFALNPFEVEPSGTCNFSKINSKTIKLAFGNNDTSNITGKHLYMFGVNYNVLIISNGMGGIQYT